MASLLLGSIPGVLVGSNLTVRLPDRALRVGLAMVLLLSGAKLLDLPGSDALVLGGVAFSLLALAVVAVRVLNRRLAPAPSRSAPR
jgi:hypothetical protein